MKVQLAEFKWAGTVRAVPMTVIEGRQVVSVGRFLRKAILNDEHWLEGSTVPQPHRFVSALAASGLGADLFVFQGPLTEGEEFKEFHHKWENLAVIRSDDFDTWWKELPQEARRYARRAAKLGVDVRCVDLDDELAKGIKAIYDEAPVRQGRKFWHYQKALERVKSENSSYLDRCQFIAAYFENQLIGFLKVVYVDDTARIMQILSLNKHQDKRTMVALVTKAVEVANKQGKKFLIYGNYSFSHKTDTSFTEFKRRLGFRPLNLPRYYVPLTLKGRVALALRCEDGLKGLLPVWLSNRLIKARERWNR